jgi:hypothetical protein
MSIHRIAVIGVLGLRLGYGLGLVVAPRRLTKSWLGESPGAEVAARALGMREAVLHAGALAAALGGRPVRPWLAASMVGDLTDVAATAAARSALPSGSARATAVVAGGSALLSGALAATDGRTRSGARP